MTDFNAAAEYVRRYAEKQRDIIALGEALKEIGMVDQATKEHQATLDKVTAQLAKATDELGAAKKEHTAFLKGRVEELATHKAALEAVTDAANKSAAATIVRANEAAKNILDAANAEVSRMQSAHAMVMVDGREELQAVRTELDTIRGEIETARIDHDLILKSTQEMKKLARMALGS